MKWVFAKLEVSAPPPSPPLFGGWGWIRILVTDCNSVVIEKKSFYLILNNCKT